MDYVLHVGLPRTGTSSIQRFLYVNRGRLADQAGAYYPPSYLDLQQGYHGPISRSLRRSKFDEVRRFLAEALEGARKHGSSRIIISGESISYLPMAHIRNFQGLLVADGEAGDVRVVIYFRNLHDLHLSGLTHRLRGGHLALEAEAIRDLARIPDPSAKVGELEKVFGESAVEVRILENAVAAGLERDFSEAAGLPWSEEYETGRASNRSPDLLTASLLSMLTSEFKLPQKAVMRAASEMAGYRLPQLSRQYLELLQPLIDDCDLSHPKLAPHREVLTRLKLRPGPSGEQYLTRLVAVLGRLRERIGEAAAEA